MPGKKRNNFGRHQQATVEANRRRVEDALAGIRRGTVFADLGALVEAVAQAAKIHRTTITRNPLYFRPVLEFFARQPGAVGIVPSGKVDATVLHAKLLAAQARAVAAERDNERLKRLVANLMTGAAAPSLSGAPTMSAAPPGEGAATAQIALALLAVLRRLADKGLGIELVAERQAIIDVTEVGEREVVAGPTRVRCLLEWLDENQKLMELTGGGDG